MLQAQGVISTIVALSTPAGDSKVDAVDVIPERPNGVGATMRVTTRVNSTPICIRFHSLPGSSAEHVTGACSWESSVDPQSPHRATPRIALGHRCR